MNAKYNIYMISSPKYKGFNTKKHFRNKNELVWTNCMCLIYYFILFIKIIKKLYNSFKALLYRFQVISSFYNSNKFLII